MDGEAEVPKDVPFSELKSYCQQTLDKAFEQMRIDGGSRQPEGINDGQMTTGAQTNESAVDDPGKDNPKRKMLKSWLNNMFRIKMTDGRVLIGIFVCTDADANVVMQVTSECPEVGGEERFLGLVMIPGRYIVSIEDRNDAGKFAW
uniref:Sm domain-containing protein n=1 Tax=Anopheles atroparvus TaxID=41427 RepID=A0AAG5CR76_ANOAO